MKKRKGITTIRDNKPINRLKERMYYGMTKERCPFCIEHFTYLGAMFIRHDVFECIFAQSAYSDKVHSPCHATPLTAGDEKVGEGYGEFGKGSPCLKADWAECPYNILRGKEVKQ